jgi:hypothetical protein
VAVTLLGDESDVGTGCRGQSTEDTEKMACKERREARH